MFISTALTATLYGGLVVLGFALGRLPGRRKSPQGSDPAMKEETCPSTASTAR